MPDYLFIYDHNILQGKEDSNYDPTEAILYFYPSSTSLDFQHSLCSHVMGFCQILSNLFQSSPKLLHMDSGAKVACIHEPHLGLIKKYESRIITFALYSDDSTCNHLHEKCTLLYESFIFYTKKCLSCLFTNQKPKDNYIHNIISRLMTLINHRSKLSSIFNTSLYCNDDKKCQIFDPIVYQTMISIMDSLQREAGDFKISVLGGCLFYKKCLIMNQFTVEVSNLFCLLIDCLNNDLVKTGKDTFSSLKHIQVNTEDLQTRNGVFIFKICVTQQTYKEIINSSQIISHSSINSCCNIESFQYLHLYLEHHSNMTIIFLIDESDFNKISKDLLKIFSSLCFQTLGAIEADIETTISDTDDTNDYKKVNANLNVWNIKYDESDRTVSTSNTCNGSNISPDWEEWLSKRVCVLHENLEKEKSIQEINVKLKKETLSVVKIGGYEIYTMKTN